MKKLFCLIFGLVVVMSCGTKQSRIDKIYEDGVEVVLNQLEPYKLRGEPSHLSLKEETRIDFEKEEYSALDLARPSFVEADSRGNIFIVESVPDSEYFIYKFSPEGTFVNKFGHKGQGPGEIQWIWDLVIDRTDRVLISDPNASKLLEFDTDGKFIKETKIPHILSEEIPLLNGNYLARRRAKDSSEGSRWYLCLFNSDFEEIKKLDSFDMSAYAPFKQNPGTMISFHWKVAGDRIFIGNEQRAYDLWIFNLDGTLLRKIRKEYKPVPYPEEFRRQTKEIGAREPALNLVPLKEMPPFNSFFSDDEGRLFVMTYEQGASPDEYIHDVFNKDGVLVARVPLGRYGIMGRALNPLRATAKKGRFYRLRFKENGYPEMIVYRMAWGTS
jgi:hypothetical protein